jgi:transposase
VIRRAREPGVRIKDIAADFGISESCLTNWLTAADVEDGYVLTLCRRGFRNPGVVDKDSGERRRRSLDRHYRALRRGPIRKGQRSSSIHQGAPWLYSLGSTDAIPDAFEFVAERWKALGQGFVTRNDRVHSPTGGTAPKGQFDLEPRPAFLRYASLRGRPLAAPALR